MTALDVSVRARAGAFELDATFTANPGVTILFGPTASGKSLTLRLVAGLERPLGGSIRCGARTFDDAARIFVPPHARELGFSPQDAAVWPHRTVLDHLTPFAASAVRAHETLALVGLGDLAARKPDRLSGGERQRLAFARALVSNRNLLLLDEPFSALDDAARIAMGEIVSARANDGAVILFVTHDRAEATRLGAHFVLFDRGKTISRPRLEE